MTNHWLGKVRMLCKSEREQCVVVGRYINFNYHISDMPGIILDRENFPLICRKRILALDIFYFCLLPCSDIFHHLIIPTVRYSESRSDLSGKMKCLRKITQNVVGDNIQYRKLVIKRKQCLCATSVIKVNKTFDLRLSPLILLS